MRVVLYYDLLRFSPCSIDLFRNEHFSPLHERLLPPLILRRCNAAVVSHTTNHNNTTRHCGVKGSLLSQRCESERRFVFSRSRTYWCVCWQCGPSGLCWYVVQICTSPNCYINSIAFWSLLLLCANRTSPNGYINSRDLVASLFEKAPSPNRCINSIGIWRVLLCVRKTLKPFAVLTVSDLGSFCVC